jgi:hypothetical protein
MLEGKLIKVPAGLGVLGEGRKAEQSETGMPYDRARLYTMGEDTPSNEITLGVLGTKVFEGAAALNAVAVNRQESAIRERQWRESSPFRRGSLNDRLHRLGVKI